MAVFEGTSEVEIQAIRKTLTPQPEAAPLPYVLAALEQSGTDTLPVAQTESHEALSEALKDFGDAMESSPANKLLKDI